MDSALKYLSPPLGGGTIEVDGVAKLFEAANQPAFSSGAVTLIAVGGPKIDKWAVVLE